MSCILREVDIVGAWQLTHKEVRVIYEKHLVARSLQNELWLAQSLAVGVGIFNLPKQLGLSIVKLCWNSFFEVWLKCYRPSSK